MRINVRALSWREKAIETVIVGKQDRNVRLKQKPHTEVYEMWRTSESQRQHKVTRVFDGLKLRFESTSSRRYRWLVKLDFNINVFCEDRTKYIRFSGDPNIGFPPGKFPETLLAQLLVRNSEVLAGAWQLDSAGGFIWCNFGIAVPYSNFKVPVVKEALELLLAETHRVALRYEHLRVI